MCVRAVMRVCVRCVCVCVRQCVVCVCTCACVCMLACVCVVQTNEERRVLREGVRWESLGRVAKQRQFPAKLHNDFSFLQSCIFIVSCKAASIVSSTAA